ncbi:MAG: FxsA family protein [Acidiferrobacterales bacterium]|nr:FxsA family protein [Acidiferrobacterales bacterium]
MPFFILVALFIGIPILEISLLIKVTAAIGGLKTILFVIFTAVLGAYLVKQQGLATFAKFQAEANAGRVPAQQMLEGLALFFAGAVLLTPGFFTDAIGFALLIPPIRQGVIAYLMRNGRIISGSNAHFNYSGPNPDQYDSQNGGTIIEGEVATPTEEPKKPLN